MNPDELQALIAQGESLTVEFKSDQGPLPDTDLIETAVCLANGQGGMLLVGVEDDRRVTGCIPDTGRIPAYWRRSSPTAPCRRWPLRRSS
jgi:ATP-dependent DNA helicase RecG